MTLVSQAEYARRLGVSSAAVAQWKKAGKLTLQGVKVDVEATDAFLEMYRRAGLPPVKPKTKTVKRGRPAATDSAKLNGKPANLTPRDLTLADIDGRLRALDYTQEFDWSPEAMKQRARLVATCLGWHAIESERRDDGHWGGFQLRIDKQDGGVAAGYGFELSACEVLYECRDQVSVDDPDDADVTQLVRLDLLPLLARPFHERDVPDD